MAEILESPKFEKPIGNEIADENMKYFTSVQERVQAEYDALVRSGNQQAMWIGKVVYDIVNGIVSRTFDAMNENRDLNQRVQAQYFMSQCMQSVNAIFAGGIISPLTGVEEEWHDVTVSEDVGQILKIQFRDKEYQIPIESVQINKRYPKIYRLNGDNKFAHRLDYIQFHDVANPNNVHLTADSIRFISFPYDMNSLHYSCIVENGEIVDYLECDINDIANGLVYADQSNSDDTYANVIASKIPLHMLEEDGIDIENEVDNYIKSIDDGESFTISNSLDDEDDDDEFPDKWDDEIDDNT